MILFVPSKGHLFKRNFNDVEILNAFTVDIRPCTKHNSAFNHAQKKAKEIQQESLLHVP
jgi:hypothetical protein